MSGDLHSPTNAGPDLGPVEPETTAPVAAGAPASSSGSSSAAVDQDPAVLVGAAFAGGFIAALILKRLRG